MLTLLTLKTLLQVNVKQLYLHLLVVIVAGVSGYAAHGLATCSQATDSHASWQVDRRDKNGGRVDDRNALLQQDVQVRAPALTVLTH